MPKRKTIGTENLVGQRIVALRKERKIKQKELLAKLQTHGIEITQPGLSALEGQQRKVTDSELVALANIFGVSLNELVRPNES